MIFINFQKLMNSKYYGKQMRCPVYTCRIDMDWHLNQSFSFEHRFSRKIMAKKIVH